MRILGTPLARSFLFLAALSSAAACGGDDDDVDVDITGDTPEEAAAEIAGAVCDQAAACGQWSFECTGEGETFDCEATHQDTDRDECYAETQEEVVADLSCVDLTPAQEDVVEDCINQVASRDCPSQEEMDEYIAALERGEEPEFPGGELPASCEQLEGFFEGC